NDVVLQGGERFINNVAQKVNATMPTLSVTQAVYKALQHLSMAPFAVEVIENTGARNFVLSNGTLTEDPITAQLVYQPIDESLKLAWDLTFYSQDHKHLWSIKVDALSGSILDKRDMVISC